MLRFGIISGVDVDKCRVRVFFRADGITSHWIPVLVPGAKGNQYFHIFEANEHVVCLMDENLTDGVCLGAIYDNSNQPLGKNSDLVSIDFPGGDKIEYDRSSQAFTVQAGTTSLEVSPTGFNLIRGGESLKSILEEIVNANIAETHNVTAVGAPSGPPINIIQYNTILTRLSSLFE